MPEPLRRHLTRAALELAAILNTVEDDDERERLHGHIEKVINDELCAGSLNRAAPPPAAVVDLFDRLQPGDMFSRRVPKESVMGQSQIETVALEGSVLRLRLGFGLALVVVIHRKGKQVLNHEPNVSAPGTGHSEHREAVTIDRRSVGPLRPKHKPGWLPINFVSEGSPASCFADLALLARREAQPESDA